MYIVQILFDTCSLVLFFFCHYLTISLFYLPGIQQQHNYTQVKRSYGAFNIYLYRLVTVRAVPFIFPVVVEHLNT